MLVMISKVFIWKMKEALVQQGTYLHACIHLPCAIKNMVISSWFVEIAFLKKQKHLFLVCVFVYVYLCVSVAACVYPPP